MIKDLRSFLRLLKYTDGVRENLIVTILILVILIFVLNTPGEKYSSLPALVTVLFMIPSVTIEQLFYAKLAGTSQKKEKALFFCDFVVLVTAILIFLTLYVNMSGTLGDILSLALFMGMEEFYNGFIMKLPVWVMLVIYLISGGIMGFAYGVINTCMEEVRTAGDGTILLLGLLIIGLGFGAVRFIRKYSGKIEINPWVMGRKLYRQMQ